MMTVSYSNTELLQLNKNSNLTLGKGVCYIPYQLRVAIKYMKSRSMTLVINQSPNTKYKPKRT